MSNSVNKKADFNDIEDKHLKNVKIQDLFKMSFLFNEKNT